MLQDEEEGGEDHGSCTDSGGGRKHVDYKTKDKCHNHFQNPVGS